MTKKLLLIGLILSLFTIGSWYLFYGQGNKSTNTNISTNLSKTTIIALGDMSCPFNEYPKPNTCLLPKISESIKNQNPEKILLLGDLQYNKGELINFQKSFDPVWGELKLKSYATAGNHEYATKNAKGYFDYWNNNQTSSEQAGERTKGYYSKNIGSWKLIALNSNCETVSCDENSEQATWLEEELSKNTYSKCIISMWHHPRFTSGKYSNDELSKNRSKIFWDLLSKYKANVILNGHDHNYQRFSRQNSQGQRDNTLGIREFIVGTGGRSLYEFNKVKSNNFEFGVDNTYGYLKMDLYDSFYEWSFRDYNGKILDSGHNSCSPKNR